MLEKKIKFTDFSGVEREETFYFNLSQSELTRWENSEAGGLAKRLSLILEKKDAPSIMSAFSDVIQMSYGVPSPDGRRFNKSKEIFEDFASTNAYDELFMELLSDSEYAAKFLEGILPRNMAAQVAAAKANGLTLAPATSAT